MNFEIDTFAKHIFFIMNRSFVLFWYIYTIHRCHPSIKPDKQFCKHFELSKFVCEDTANTKSVQYAIKQDFILGRMIWFDIEGIYGHHLCF